MGSHPREAIQAMVDRETIAWNEQDVETLLDLFHPDMVWAWPPTAYDHDPVDWDLEFGRYDRQRWRTEWQALFDSHDLVRNDRSTREVTVSEQEDAGMAVVDIDTLWRHRETGDDFRWSGRTAKLYTLVDDGWRLIAHWGALAFDDGEPIAGP